MSRTSLLRGQSNTGEGSDSGVTYGYDKPLPDPFGFNDGYGFRGAPPAKPLVELEMTRLSAELRRKPSWWTKFRDESILAKWKGEALTQTQLMDESHIDYVLKELDGYANLRDETSGAEVSCYDKIWQSDTLIPASLKERLLTGVTTLEDVPESEKDWHPRSDGKVLDLVHPSLYPIVYGRTLSYPEDSDDRNSTALQVRLEPPKAGKSQATRIDEYYLSKRFQWLPTNFEVSEDGKSVKGISYINNLHPFKHADLYKTIEGLIAAYIPLFERVLTDSIPENNVIPERTFNGYSYDEEYKKSPQYSNYSDEDKFDQDHREWEEGRPIQLPFIQQDYQIGNLEKRPIQYKLNGRTIQVIVKLANIHLTPEKPKYDGGSWHVEGMKNEAIAASGIYYYDEENITESRLGFRTAVAGPESYEQNDLRGCKLTWGMGYDDPCINDLGSVVTCQDRCIAFPNIYQHRVSPFELADNSKRGHRKIVALFLVDPAIHRPSTAIVPPQQADWRASGISANPVLKAAFNKLSAEIIDHINSMAEGTMTRKEAEAYRLELMDERTAFVAKNDENFFMAPFSLCEH
ncbi:hypothetical protein RHS04_08771 [Rhizoctonia solani]|uniref:Uncharacterized protein n=1 Tax=Rhizoctonia solani TaxID=456999 RepID=A0A8H7H114_9AGAM|nr:hypothetical protein RHS04_08771 [Rhizoctonia solani]